MKEKTERERLVDDIYYVSRADTRSSPKIYPKSRTNNQLKEQQHEEEITMIRMSDGENKIKMTSTEKKAQRNTHTDDDDTQRHSDKLKSISHQLTFNYLSRIFNLLSQVSASAAAAAAVMLQYVSVASAVYKYLIVREAESTKIDLETKLPMSMPMPLAWVDWSKWKHIRWWWQRRHNDTVGALAVAVAEDASQTQTFGVNLINLFIFKLSLFFFH